MARNLYRQFLDLIPRDPLLVGEVTSHNSDGTSTLSLPGGGTLRARGQGVAVGLKAFVQAGEVKGEAPDLTDVTVEV
ncbi:hypothetical protein SAMN04487957_105100 [Halomonas shengliensis]|uniref:Uncharacterized protein n=1 Tax=Halomonas shengliensis TaxID=419597 RepID=A0A1H0IFF8_9GAMM|nr:hypothetical protein [Halomonas shengliensis]SDO30105.1 hypothetical protein SAMN04487957_105100 [Halomonas shengliensis]